MVNKQSGAFRLTFECSVVDATALWDAAALIALTDFSMASDDVVETIGPREDPDIEACVAMLFDHPLRRSGLNSIVITAVRAVDDGPGATAPRPSLADAHADADRAWMSATRAA